ncbi:MAG TPA: hypothetical protein VEP68_10625, partial [Anaeromyxobacteraceae bacterium]|nr:hypothetical protein [Anaeromyxobacteraceae bacterium]
MSLVAHLAGLAGALRQAGVRVSTGDEVDALRALLRIDLGDPEEVRRALRCTLRIRPADAGAFEALFADLWARAGSGGPARAPPAPRPGPGRGRAGP